MYHDLRPLPGKSPESAEKRQAVALYYRRDLPAPLILARGTGFLAEQILASAEMAEVPIIKDRTASGMLIQLDVGQIIPESCYEIAAELFRFVQNIETKGH
ncbi:EscU/YscU/HrcU family type III secretion system export apparatus switch protein [Salinispira pacifica]|uniref:Flagellar biosynthesis protein FlhB n=1 Tax=Salinispira pacifica TaxID=1307761 RepID=V5WHN0_9SPIO|nr:EscU/YscU/HrcU family type III secretion system export apparatus switch protein [Salinispira pacifica]AHC15125.1 Flagellar biosynthesis protein FlhB [Salinispira pacifica]